MKITNSDRRDFVEEHLLTQLYFPDRFVGRAVAKCSCGEERYVDDDPNSAAIWWGMHLLEKAGFDGDLVTVKRDMLALLREVRAIADRLDDYTEGEDLRALVVKYI